MTKAQHSTLHCLRGSQPDKGYATVSRRTGLLYVQFNAGMVIVDQDGGIVTD